MRLTCFSFIFPLVLLFTGCAGLFRNPDLTGDGKLPYGLSATVQLPEATDRENRLYREMRDTTVVRFPEYQFYWLQQHMIDLVQKTAVPSVSPAVVADSIPRKDITRLERFDSPAIDPVKWLQRTLLPSVRVYRLKRAPVKYIAACIKSGIPLLIFGESLYKRKVSRPDENNPIRTRNLLRRMERFDILYGYERLSGLGQHLPGPRPPVYRFLVRSRFDFRAPAHKNLYQYAAPLSGGASPGSHWRLFHVYLFVSDDSDAQALQERTAAIAEKLDYPNSPPVWEVLN